MYLKNIQKINQKWKYFVKNFNKPKMKHFSIFYTFDKFYTDKHFRCLRQ